MRENSGRKRVKTQIDFSLELYERIQMFSNISEEDPTETIAQFYNRFFPYMNSLKYFILKLPYDLRLYIIDYISVISSRFMINTLRGVTKVFSYEKKNYVNVRSYIHLMYGYFRQDFTRRAYLVFGYLVFRIGNVNRLYHIPQNQLRQVYILDGYINDYSDLPDRLQSLCLCKMTVQKKIFLPVLKRLKKLRKFAVKEIKGLNDLDIMKELRKVQVIRIMECGLDSKCCQILCGSKNIVILNLCENANITSFGLEPFQYNTRATLLSLDDSGVDDEGVRYIERNRTVHQVEMNGTNITSRGLLTLVAHPSIRWIEAGNIVFDKIEFSDVNKIIRPREGVDYTNNFRSLEKLLLDIATIPRILFQVFEKYCHGLSYISLCNSQLTDYHLKMVLRFPSLTGLAVSYNPYLTYESVISIKGHPKIERLEYCQEELGNRDVEKFFQSRSIQTLWVEGRKVTNDCLLCLEKNKVLNQLLIHGETKIDRFGIEFIKRACTSVKELKYSQISDESNDRETVVWLRD